MFNTLHGIGAQPEINILAQPRLYQTKYQNELIKVSDLIGRCQYESGYFYIFFVRNNTYEL